MNIFARKQQTVTVKDLFGLGGCIALYMAIALGNITRWSIWFDEGFTAYLMRYDFAGIARYTASDVHPPMYYWLLKIWTLLFGTTDMSLRSFSMIVIAAAIVLAYFLVRKLFGSRAALWSALFMAISPMLVRFGEEARMYGLAVLVAVAATYMLVLATEKPTTRRWVLYGVLVSVGMWVHYFTALAWLAHWVWRWLVRGQLPGTQTYFSKPWLYAYGLSILLYAPWLSHMAQQLGTVQSTGFWIKAVSIDTPVNWVSNVLMFLEHNDATGYAALALIAGFIAILLMAKSTYRAVRPKQKPWLLLVVCMAILPPLLLFVVSLPPLRPAFIERYVLPSALWSAVLIGISVAHNATVRRDKKGAYLAAALVICIMLFGVTNVYKYGNFNRNAKPNEAQSVKQVLQTIHKNDTQVTPIIADSAWRFYEAIQYDSPEHPVYFIADDSVTYGSYNMLRYSDYRKIKNLSEFAKQYQTVWYLYNWYNDDIRKPNGEWTAEQHVVGPSPVKEASVTRAIKLKST